MGRKRRQRCRALGWDRCGHPADQSHLPEQLGPPHRLQCPGARQCPWGSMAEGLAPLCHLLPLWCAESAAVPGCEDTCHGSQPKGAQGPLTRRGTFCWQGLFLTGASSCPHNWDVSSELRLNRCMSFQGAVGPEDLEMPEAYSVGGGTPSNAGWDSRKGACSLSLIPSPRSWGP